MNACEDRVGDTTRVLLVEDHALFRQALSLLLRRHPHMEVTQAGTLAEARLLLGSVDVVALDRGAHQQSGSFGSRPERCA
jgi:DNA-binding NarL/FixJ family response regulator